MFATTTAMAGPCSPAASPVFNTDTVTTPSLPAQQSAPPTDALAALAAAIYGLQRQVDDFSAQMAALAPVAWPPSKPVWSSPSPPVWLPPSTPVWSPPSPSVCPPSAPGWPPTAALAPVECLPPFSIAATSHQLTRLAAVKGTPSPSAQPPLPLDPVIPEDFVAPQVPQRACGLLAAAESSSPSPLSFPPAPIPPFTATSPAPPQQHCARAFFGGVDGIQASAAVRLQAAARGLLARRRLQKMRLEMQKAALTTIDLGN